MGTPFPASNSILDGIPANKLDAIFHHPDCRKVFDERVGVARIEESEQAGDVNSAFTSLILKISYAELSLSDDEFKDCIRSVHDQDLQIHTGVILKIISIIEASKPEDYCEDVEDYENVINSCQALKNQINDLITPIRDEVVEEFYTNATREQLADIDKMVKQQSERRQMPGLSQSSFQNGLIMP